MNKSTRYSPEVRERAVRLVFENQGEHDSQWAAIGSIAGKIGCTAEALRKWVRQAERQRLRLVVLSFLLELPRRRRDDGRTRGCRDLRNYSRDVEHIQDKRANNRAENSHQPTRERERRMRGFKSAGHAQLFLRPLGWSQRSFVQAVIC